MNLIDTQEPPHPADARLEEDTRLSRREVADSLPRILMLRAQKKAIEEELSVLEGHVKQALEDDREPLQDDLGNTAVLVERSRPADFDLINFSKKPDAGRLLAEAASQGLIKVQATQTRGLKGRSEAADALLSVESNGGVSYSLTIQEAK